MSNIFTLVITEAGETAMAAGGGVLNLDLTHLAFGSSGFESRGSDGAPTTAARTATQLGSEQARIPITTGGNLGNNQAVLIGVLPGGTQFTVREFGVFDANGILWAIGSKPSGAYFERADQDTAIQFLFGWSQSGDINVVTNADAITTMLAVNVADLQLAIAALQELVGDYDPGDFLGKTEQAVDAVKLGGVNASTSATVSTIARRDASGDLYMRYGEAGFFAMSHPVTYRGTDNTFYSSSDRFIRKNTASGFKTSLGLNNVSNTSDAAKPISMATQAALDAKLDGGNFNPADFLGKTETAVNSVKLNGLTQSLVAAGDTIARRNGNGDINMRYAVTQFVQMTHAAAARTTDTEFYSGNGDGFMRKTTRNGLRGALDLGNVDDSSDAAKPISTATKTALDAKLDKAGGMIDGDLVINGNLRFSGSTTIVNTTTLETGDNIVVLNKDVTGSPSTNAGVEIERGNQPNTTFLWVESAGRFETNRDMHVNGDFSADAGAFTALSEDGTLLSGKYLGLAAKAADANKLAGYFLSTGAGGNTVARRDGSGDLIMRYAVTQYVKMTHATTDRTTDNVFYSGNGDGLMRHTTRNGMREALDLGNVDNTSDAAKPISTATQTALDGKLGNTGGTVSGAIRITKNRTVTANSSLLAGDYRVFVKAAAAGPVTITLPAGFDGCEFIIKDALGTAPDSNIIIAAAAGQLIDGEPTITIANAFNSVSLVWAGDRWCII